ncbi:MAG: four helix bundle protein [Planctomycetota bacterium]
MAYCRVEDLDVYKLAERVGDAVWKIVVQWSHFERSTVGSQLTRSADSIGANIAEGAGRGSFNDNKRFVRIARGSLNETRFWLRRACTRNLMTKQQADELKPLFDELAPKLNAYLKSIGPSTKDNQQRTKDI